MKKKKEDGESVPNCKFSQCSLVPKLCDMKAHGKTKKTQGKCQFIQCKTACNIISAFEKIK